MDSASLSEDYFNKNHVSGWTKQSLLDVCQEACIIVSSDVAHFKGIEVGKLKKKMVCATYVDIQHVIAAPGVNNIDRKLEE